MEATVLKKTIYPKTIRYNPTNHVVITEKMDGSNLVFFKYEGELYIALRNNIFPLSATDDARVRQLAYPGLLGWLESWGEQLKSDLHEEAAICGEWLGMGSIKTYDLSKRFLVYAKANINHKFALYNIFYNHDLLKYSFVEQEVPSYINLVPVVAKIPIGLLNLELLDGLFEDYEKEEGRMVEGFVVATSDTQISKYVRRKGGQLNPHRWN